MKKPTIATVPSAHATQATGVLIVMLTDEVPLLHMAANAIVDVILIALVKVREIVIFNRYWRRGDYFLVAFNSWCIRLRAAGSFFS